MTLALIPILSSVLEFIADNIINLAGGVGALFMVILAYLARTYLVPFLKLEHRRRYAVYIATIADEVTDDLVRRYPDRHWLKYLDQAVDKIIEICNIDRDIAERAASAALSRK